MIGKHIDKLSKHAQFIFHLWEKFLTFTKSFSANVKSESRGKEKGLVLYKIKGRVWKIKWTSFNILCRKYISIFIAKQNLWRAVTQYYWVISKSE